MSDPLDQAESETEKDLARRISRDGGVREALINAYLESAQVADFSRLTAWLVDRFKEKATSVNQRQPSAPAEAIRRVQRFREAARQLFAKFRGLSADEKRLLGLCCWSKMGETWPAEFPEGGSDESIGVGDRNFLDQFDGYMAGFFDPFLPKASYGVLSQNAAKIHLECEFIHSTKIVFETVFGEPATKYRDGLFERLVSIALPLVGDGFGLNVHGKVVRALSDDFKPTMPFTLSVRNSDPPGEF